MIRMMLSAVLVLLLAGPAGAQSDPRSAYDQTPNAGIPGYNREILNGQSLDACLAACLDRDWCESVDFQRANGSCFLQPISERSSGKSLLKRNYPGHPYDHWARNHGTPTPAPAHRIVAAAPPDPVPAPPSSAPEMASGGCSWSTDFGPLDLPAHLPDDVRLGYGDEGGFILGQVFDRRVVGIWVQPRSDRMCDNARAGSRHWGQIHFDIDRPGGRLTGLWGMCDDPPNRPWRGTGTGCEAAAPPPPPRPKAPPEPAAPPPPRPAPEALAPAPPPLAQPVLPVATCGWKTTYGDVAFPQPLEGPVRAPYGKDDGRLLGTIENGVLTGHWVERGAARACQTTQDGSRYWGLIRFEFAPDGQSFTGRWSYCDGAPTRTWSGTRQPCDAAAPPPPPIPAPAPPPPGPGAWTEPGAKTAPPAQGGWSEPTAATCRWSTDFGPLDLPRDLAGRTRATYGADGRLFGDIRGDTLEGHWVENDSARRCATARDGSPHWGRITATFDLLGETFEGAWGYCEDTPQSAWRGQRVSCP